MTIEYIPLPTPDQTLLRTSPTLEGVTYLFQFDWNGRTDSWTLSIRDARGSLIIAGIKLVPTFNLLSAAVSEDAPPGFLTIASVGSADVTRANIGDVKLVYITQDEFL